MSVILYSSIVLTFFNGFLVSTARAQNAAFALNYRSLHLEASTRVANKVLQKLTISGLESHIMRMQDELDHHNETLQNVKSFTPNEYSAFVARLNLIQQTITKNGKNLTSILNELTTRETLTYQFGGKKYPLDYAEPYAANESDKKAIQEVYIKQKTFKEQLSNITNRATVLLSLANNIDTRNKIKPDEKPATQLPISTTTDLMKSVTEQATKAAENASKTNEESAKAVAVARASREAANPPAKAGVAEQSAEPVRVSFDELPAPTLDHKATTAKKGADSAPAESADLKDYRKKLQLTEKYRQLSKDPTLSPADRKKYDDMRWKANSEMITARNNLKDPKDKAAAENEDNKEKWRAAAKNSLIEKKKNTQNKFEESKRTSRKSVLSVLSGLTDGKKESAGEAYDALQKYHDIQAEIDTKVAERDASGSAEEKDKLNAEIKNRATARDNEYKKYREIIESNSDIRDVVYEGAKAPYAMREKEQKNLDRSEDKDEVDEAEDSAEGKPATQVTADADAAKAVKKLQSDTAKEIEYKRLDIAAKNELLGKKIEECKTIEEYEPIIAPSCEAGDRVCEPLQENAAIINDLTEKNIEDCKGEIAAMKVSLENKKQALAVLEKSYKKTATTTTALGTRVPAGAEDASVNGEAEDDALAEESAAAAPARTPSEQPREF